MLETAVLTFLRGVRRNITPSYLARICHLISVATTSANTLGSYPIKNSRVKNITHTWLVRSTLSLHCYIYLDMCDELC